MSRTLSVKSGKERERDEKLKEREREEKARKEDEKALGKLQKEREKEEAKEKEKEREREKDRDRLDQKEKKKNFAAFKSTSKRKLADEAPVHRTSEVTLNLKPRAVVRVSEPNSANSSGGVDLTSSDPSPLGDSSTGMPLNNNAASQVYEPIDNMLSEEQIRQRTSPMSLLMGGY